MQEVSRANLLGARARPNRARRSVARRAASAKQNDAQPAKPVAAPSMPNEQVQGVAAPPPLAATSVSATPAGSLVAVAAVAAAGGAIVTKLLDSKPAAEAVPTPFGTPSADVLSPDSATLAKNIGYHAKHSAATKPLTFQTPQAYKAVANSVEERLVERWDQTYEHFTKTDPKMAYYISMEYLMGRTMANGIRNIGLKDEYEEALHSFGQELEIVEEQERDAGLGNGGLGRLAACFLDSLATLDMPAWGYGLRYKYGLFKQKVSADGQSEVPDDWLDVGNPWEVKRDDIRYPIRFFGEVDANGKWTGGEEVEAVAFDSPVPGYNTKNTISLRLWSVEAVSTDFDLVPFNDGKHLEAQEAQVKATEICAVLYPGDDSLEGKALRLRQQYLLCSASIQDIMNTFKERQALKGNAKPKWSELSEKVAVQMNDTHPTLAAPELMRLLMDQEGLSWDQAWKIVQKTVNYTNHTVLPEALEKWPLTIMDALVPRHMQIIRRIDAEFKAGVKALPGESKEELKARIDRMKIIDEPEPAKSADRAAAEQFEEPTPGVVRMANLCVVAAQAVNGVAALHTEIVKAEVFNDFYNMWPAKFQNKTNGVTPRRWLAWCNPELSAVISKWLGTDAWIKDLDLLSGLLAFKDDKALHKEWAEAKMIRKEKLVTYLKEWTGIEISKEMADTAMFDVQVKRIHEYKRQLLNVMAAIYRYKKIKEMTPTQRKEVTPRVIMIGGKAFATYYQAKRIVQLICKVGETVNNDKDCEGLLKVVFVPNYSVTVAEKLIPAAELTQQISTAGMEASGTSNMKFMMNGSLTVGTLDGANVEIREEAGAENFFLFGAVTEDIPVIRADRAAGKFVPDARLTEVMDYIRSGVFGGLDFDELLGSLEGNEGFGRGDYFCVGHDFPSYLEAQAAADAMYKDQDAWTTASIVNTATSGKFSSDRTIEQYCREIWDIKPSPVPEA